MKEYCTFFRDPGLKPHHQMVLYHNPEHSLGGSYSSAEMQSAYSITPAEWVYPFSQNENILVYTSLWCLYCKTKAVQVMEITFCGEWNLRSWYTETLFIASFCKSFESCQDEHVM